MSSELPVILFAILVVLLMGAVIFLALLHTKTTTNQLRFLMQSQEQSELAAKEQANLYRESTSEILERHSSRASESEQAVLSSLASAQRETIALLTETVKQTTFGASSNVAELAKLVSSTTTFLATKDPIAYQVGMGAQQFAPESHSAAPYTSTDVEAVLEAQERQRAADAALEMMARFVGGTPDVADYPVSQ